MLELLAPTAGTHCDRISRRRLLQAGGLSAAGLSLSGLLRAEAATAAGSQAKRAKSCIIIFLDGGPSHLDMWDMKPNAPAEVRGEFKALPTPVDGIQMSEHLPRLGKLSRDYALLRSVSHDVVVAHALAVYLALTGDLPSDPGVSVGQNQKAYPSIGSVMSRIYPSRGPMAPYVCLPYRTQEGAGGPPQDGFYGGWMGQQYDPLYIEKDPNSPNFSLPELTLPADFTPRRVELRGKMLQSVNRELDALNRHGEYTALDAFQQKALELVSSSQSRRAFDIAQEPDAVRERYGRNIYGQSVLLARRLVEAGCRTVTVSWAPNANATWDTHGNNFGALKGTLLPQLDACLASLLADLKERGLLDETLVVCMGEFGRSPKINGGAGRDHYPGCYSLLMAGGGVKGGRVVGQSDDLGATPAETPLSPQDVIATIYTLLGIPPETEFRDATDRPRQILSTPGRFIHELV